MQEIIHFGSKSFKNAVWTHPKLFSGSYSTVLSIHSGKFYKNGIAPGVQKPGIAPGIPPVIAPGIAPIDAMG